jgi:hypothetical protein
MQHIAGLVKNRFEAQRIIENLLGNGFSRAQVHTVVRDNVTELDLAGETGIPSEESVPAGIFAGGFVGVATGLVIGLVSAWIYGQLVFSGMVPAIVIHDMNQGLLAGGLAGSLIGLYIGSLNGMFGGHLGRTLERFGMAEQEIKEYLLELRKGRILLIIEADDEARAKLVRTLLPALP